MKARVVKPSIFIGSSKEQLPVLEAIVLNLHDCADVTPWTLAFRDGQPFFTELLRLKDRFDFAAILLTPDDILQSRGKEYLAPRDNVIFELGMFLGSLGPERVFAIIDKTISPKIMTDYQGVKCIDYDGGRVRHEINEALNPGCIRIKQAIQNIGPRPSTESAKSVLFPGEMIGLESIYDNMIAAERNILADLSSDPGPIRLFFHIASKDVGLKGKLFDVIDSIAQEGMVDLRILHASPSSPLFSRDRLISLGKRPERVLASLKQVDESLRELEALAASSLRRRTHEDPFLWRVYALSSRLYFMPYFAVRDATDISPVLVFAKGDRSLYQTFLDWFDYSWERSAPQRVRLSDLISPAAPSGAALFLQWEDRHVFGIPKRDIGNVFGQVRFYGLGGKRVDRDESFEDCALREGNEEASKTVQELLTSSATDHFKIDDTINTIVVTGERIVPRLIFEKRTHSGSGTMKKDDDSYFLVAYDAKLISKPVPSRELAAIIFLTDRHLSIFAQRPNTTLQEILDEGAYIEEQKGYEIPRLANLVPHGTALYMVRMSS